MMDLKNKTALVVDHGQYVELASRLSQDFGRVLYTTSWQTAYPEVQECFIGHRIPGIEVVRSPWGTAFDEADVVVFPHLHFADEQVRMEKMGKAVWGCRSAELLELSREGLKRVQEQAGLPVGEYDIVRGMTALREYIQKNPGCIVKTSLYRGSWDTIRCESYEAVKSQLDLEEYKMGPTAEDVVFVCEKPLKDMVEIGYDGWCVDGKFPSRCLFGIEDKDAGYLAKLVPYDKVPKCVRDVNTALMPMLRRYGQRGFISTEVRAGKNDKGFLIDITQRRPSPPGELYDQFDNLSEIIYRGAHGEVVDPESEYEWFAMLRIKSERARRNWQSVIFPEEIKPYVQLINCLRDQNGVYCVAPQHVEMVDIGGVFGRGKTKEEAFKMCQDNAKKVTEKSHGLTIVDGSLEKIQSEIDKAKDLGIKMPYD